MGGRPSRMEVGGMTEDAVNQLANKLRWRVAQVTQETLVDIMKTFDFDQNKKFIRGAQWHETGEAMSHMLETKGVSETFEVMIIRVMTSAPIVQATAKAIIKEEQILETAANLVAVHAKRDVSKAMQQSTTTAAPSWIPPLDDSSSSEKQWKPMR